jgi:hypothetical protein
MNQRVIGGVTAGVVAVLVLSMVGFGFGQPGGGNSLPELVRQIGEEVSDVSEEFGRGRDTIAGALDEIKTEIESMQETLSQTGGTTGSIQIVPIEARHDSVGRIRGALATDRTARQWTCVYFTNFGAAFHTVTVGFFDSDGVIKASVKDMVGVGEQL